MNGSPAVIVNKSGFFSSVAKGIFGVLMVSIVCVTALGLYGMRMVDHQAGNFVEALSRSVPEILDSLNPILGAEATEYRSSVEVSARMTDVPVGDRERLAVVEVTNKGHETVTLLGLHLTVENDDGVPIMERVVYGATPFAFEEGCGPRHEAAWRGKLPPGMTRKIPVRLWDLSKDFDGSVMVQVTDLRIKAPQEAAAPAAMLPTPPAVPAQPAAPAPPAPTGRAKPTRPESTEPEEG